MEHRLMYEVDELHFLAHRSIGVGHDNADRISASLNTSPKR